MIPYILFDNVKERKIFWTYHVNMRMKGRFIPRHIIIDSVQNYEITEAYPEDKYLPSYLVYSFYETLLFHVLFAVDVVRENVRVITSYYPDSEEWEANFKKRRRRS